jgi:hypothetical protein
VRRRSCDKMPRKGVPAMHVLKRTFASEPHPDDMPSWQDVYSMVTTRASTALRTAAVVVVVVAVLWGIGAIAMLVAGILLMRNYVRHHRISGTLIHYQESGDWAVVEMDDGTQVTARCPIANLPAGAEVLVAVRREGAYVIAPSVWEGVPADEVLIEVTSK